VSALGSAFAVTFQEDEMRQDLTTSIAAVVLIAVLAIPLQFAAQDNTENHKHHHYKLIDMGTFGGNFSAMNFAVDINDRAIARRGTTVGFSETAVPRTATSQPLICGGDDGFGSNVTHAFQWQDGAVTDLGALSLRDTNCSNAYQVNGGGEIAGFSENGKFDPQIGFNQSRAVRWKDGEIEELGSFGGNQNEALAINNRGQIVGFSLNTIPDPFSLYDSIFGSPNGTQTRAFLWQGGRMRDIGTLGGNDAAAFYINDRGQIAGFSYTSTAANPVTGLPPIDPFLWDDGKMIDLGSLGGAVGMFTGFGGGLNNRGQVIGMSSIAADPGACLNSEMDLNCHPFLWDSGEMTDLATTTLGASPITADAISDTGMIVGGADFSASGGSSFEAYVWREGVALDLGVVSTRDCFSRAGAINAKSQIVGNSFACSDGSFDRGFLWEHGSIVDLNDVIPGDSTLQLAFANDINDRGEIAGMGVPSGVDPSMVLTLGHAFLLIPCDENHPGIDGCDYGMVEGRNAVSQTSPARRDAAMLAPSLLRRMSPHRFPGAAFGPRN